MLEALFTLGSATLILLLGLLVIYNSAQDRLRRLFFGFCVAMSFWQVTLFYSEKQNHLALFLNRLTFIGPIVAVTLFFFFTRRLGTAKRMQHHKSLLFSVSEQIAVGVTLLTCVISLGPGVVSRVRPRFGSGGIFSGYDLDRGPLYFAYVAVLLLLLGLAVHSLIVLRSDRDPEVRRRSNTIMAGVVSAAGIGIFANVLLPIILSTSEFSYLGSIAVLTLAVVLTVAIAKHKLINVQLVVARSFAYLLSVVSITVIYLIALLVIIRALLGSQVDTATEITLGIVFIIGSLLFRSIKTNFDKLTNKIFYQDAYDPQEMYDQLNTLLVSTLDLRFILSRTAQILATNMRVQFCVIGFQHDKDRPPYILGTEKITMKPRDLAEMRSLTPTYQQSVIVTEELGDVDYQLKHILDTYNIAVLVRLSSDVKSGEEGQGYIVLGAKKSGNPYTSQDKRVLDSVANELIIATQNALHFEEIQKFNITLQRGIEEATAQLRKTNAKLKALDETKDDFISMASHQLRTPLTSVKGYLSMVLEGDAGQLTPMQRKMLDQAFISSQRMVFLIADLLNVSRLKTGKFVIEPSPVNLAKTVNDEINQLKETAKNRSLDLTYTKPADFPTLMIDDTKIRQVIMNFIDNAIYYTPAGGKIHVELTNKPHTVELRVIDTGIGVPKREQPHLFTKFYRAGNARQARPDGTGLGLFMARKVIVAQGGAVIFESEEGKGSTFGFIFSKEKLGAPNSPAQVPAAQAVKA